MNVQYDAYVCIIIELIMDGLYRDITNPQQQQQQQEGKAQHKVQKK